ncbi:hypothetical protein IT575_12080 [bacterium]|nr:hypothetical protein [bacterium]
MHNPSLVIPSARQVHDRTVELLWQGNGAEYARRLQPFASHPELAPGFLQFAAVFERAIEKHGHLSSPLSWHSAESAGVAALFFERRAEIHCAAGEHHKGFADFAIAGCLRGLALDAGPAQSVEAQNFWNRKLTAKAGNRAAGSLGNRHCSDSPGC